MYLKYQELFKPFNIGKIEIKNRIVMSPMLTGGWFDENGVITNEVIDYYEERAKGGVGLIYTTAFTLNHGLETATMLFVSPFTHPERFLTQMKKLTDRIHPYDTKLFIQLTLGNGRVMAPFLLDGAPISASENPNWWVPGVNCRPLNKEEVERLVQSAVEAAVWCRQTGCDGVDIVGAYGGYLGDQFATDVFNRRTDEYGGSLDGKLKVFIDIVKGIKALCGAEFPVTTRLGAKHYMKGMLQSPVPGEKYKEFGRDLEESIAMAQKLEEAGYDGILAAGGTYDSLYWLYPPMYQKDGLWLEDVAKLKGHVSIPIICPGKITMPQLANDAIKNKMVDAVALGRALLADPEWANKAKLGEDEAIRPCIGCNNGCLARDFAGLPLQCAVNADLFNEKNATLRKVDKPKKIAVIGGGIAGMEAARIAAYRGHDVTLYEKNSLLGGMVIAGSVPKFKDADRRLLKWYEKELKDAGVTVKLGCSMTLEQVERLDSDEIVVATGATARVPPIPGVERAHVVTAVEVLLGEKETGRRVTLIGGGQVGCELALWLEEKGRQVTLVEALDGLMTSGKEALFMGNKMMLTDMLAYKKIKVMLSTKVLAIAENSVDVVTKDGSETIPADSVVLAIGYHSNDRLYKAINSTVPKKVWLLGDAKTPGNIMFAVKDGAAIGRVL
jgi:2-enoate reductase